MLDYILKARKDAGTLPDNAVALKSIVSSELSTAIAENYQTKMVNVLTGFKFIAEKIRVYRRTARRHFYLDLKKAMVIW